MLRLPTLQAEHVLHTVTLQNMNAFGLFARNILFTCDQSLKPNSYI